jgi:hypothetical protein
MYRLIAFALLLLAASSVPPANVALADDYLPLAKPGTDATDNDTATKKWLAELFHRSEFAGFSVLSGFDVFAGPGSVQGFPAAFRGPNVVGAMAIVGAAPVYNFQATLESLAKDRCNKSPSLTSETNTDFLYFHKEGWISHRAKIACVSAPMLTYVSIFVLAAPEWGDARGSHYTVFSSSPVPEIAEKTDGKFYSTIEGILHTIIANDSEDFGHKDAKPAH